MDEPLSGLDPLGRKEVKDIILRLKGEGKTIFFCSHVLPDVEMICERIGILNKGRLVAVGTLDKLLQIEAKGVDIEFLGVTQEGMKKIKKEAVRCLEQPHRVQITIDKEDRVMDILRWIDKYDGKIISVVPHRRSLEEIFVSKLGLERKNV